MTTERIKAIQQTTGYPYSVPVQQALLQVWKEIGRTPRVRETVTHPNGSIDIFFEDNDLLPINIIPNKSFTNAEDNSEAAIGQRCYDLIEHIEQQCADYRKIVKTGRMTGGQHLTDKEFETLSARITPAFHDIAIDGVKKAKADVLRKLRIIFDNIIDNRS